jgi:hypothetical protein
MKIEKYKDEHVEWVFLGEGLKITEAYILLGEM